ncbi:MAG: hypothetical protein HUK12_03060, partial [Muribaculaceae bacterium]|nr:hypothetical protein [Muribaculaceae bacterium]
AAVAAVEARNAESRLALAIAAGNAEPPKSGRKPRQHPAGSVSVGLTASVSSDGTGAPCTKADTAGRRGKDGGEAGTREVKLLTVTIYDRVDAKGRPIVNKGCIIYFAGTGGADEFAGQAVAILRAMKWERFSRLQFVSDGAKWQEAMLRSAAEASTKSKMELKKRLNAYKAQNKIKRLGDNTNSGSRMSDSYIVYFNDEGKPEAFVAPSASSERHDFLTGTTINSGALSGNNYIWFQISK